MEAAALTIAIAALFLAAIALARSFREQETIQLRLPEQTCRGTTASGERCRQTMGLDAAGYCRAHRDQEAVGDGRGME